MGNLDSTHLAEPTVIDTYARVLPTPDTKEKQKRIAGVPWLSTEELLGACASSREAALLTHKRDGSR